MDGFSERLAAEVEGIEASMESLSNFIDSQKILFHSQVDEMQKVIATQYRLTGVNPLSQEMAAGALNIPIGKKPRDLLNPKVVAYMQEIFSVKDKISKKETREIAAQFGISLAQVRDYFASQRVRVRDIVQSVQEVFHDKSTTFKEIQDGSQDNKYLEHLNDHTPMITVGTGTCDSNVLEAFKPAVNNIASQNAFMPAASNDQCDSPEFSLATCIPISDDEDTPDKLCKSETTPQKYVCSTFTEHLPLNVVPLTSTELLVSNHPTICNDGKHSNSIQEESTPGLDVSDKNFVENIFNLMSTERKFTGQVKLMEGILKIRNPSLLDWFLTKGGVLILATWLGEAALEEQTSVLHIILKVLCHLPLAKAVAEHMSVILQSVNSLRFYRTQDISKKARILLARWSKLFAKTQPTRTTNGMKSRNEITKQTLLSQSIKEVISDESRHLQLENTDGKLTSSNQASETLRKRERPEQMELLTTSANESIKRKSLGPSSSQGKDRRKVQLVEHPGQIRRSRQGSRASASQSRPVSTDDIQKAKLRKEFLEAKYGKKKTDESGKQGIGHVSPVSIQPVGCERWNPALSIPTDFFESKTDTIQDPNLTDEKRHNVIPLRNTKELVHSTPSIQSDPVKLGQHASTLMNDKKKQPMMSTENTYDEQCMVDILNSKKQTNAYPENGAKQVKQLVSFTTSSSISEPLIKSNGVAEHTLHVPSPSSIVQQSVRRQMKTIPDSKEPFWKQCKRVQIPWKVPPGMVINDEWGIRAGQDSRELQDQKSRNKREKEFLYKRPEEIPQNPKNPWENELDYDDSLTPVIPIEQVLDTIDTLQLQTSMPLSSENVLQRASVPAGVSSSVHDPVLLDALLKNPDLVFQLTSKQGTNMTSEETVRLLDLLKDTRGDLPAGKITRSIAEGFQETEERVECSLPSPTPSINHGTSGWQAESASSFFSNKCSSPNTGNYAYPGVAAQVYDKNLPSTVMARSQLSSANHFHRMESPTPQFQPSHQFETHYNSNFSNSILHSPTPHMENITSVKPYNLPISNETSMMDNRSALGYRSMQPVYSSYATGQSHQQPAYDHLSQPAYHSTARLQSQQQDIYERQPHIRIPMYASSRLYEESPGSTSDSLRQRGLAADSYAQVNSNNYASTQWYKDENVTSFNQFESWSPPHSGSSLSADYVSGTSQPSTASNYRPDHPKLMKFPSGYGGASQNGNGRWNGRERRH